MVQTLKKIKLLSLKILLVVNSNVLLSVMPMIMSRCGYLRKMVVTTPFKMYSQGPISKQATLAQKYPTGQVALLRISIL